jgi:beta-glucanase (GH16 family)
MKIKILFLGSAVMLLAVCGLNTEPVYDEITVLREEAAQSYSLEQQAFTPVSPKHSDFVPGGYSCMWSDEFGGSRNGGQGHGRLNEDVWTPEILQANNELQGYTKRFCDSHPDNYNICQREGMMELRARNEPINCGKADGSSYSVDELPAEPFDKSCAEDWGFRNGEGQTALNSYDYTSGRVITKKSIEFKYGYVEFSALMPQFNLEKSESGLWPAVWTLGARINEGPCPNCYLDGGGTPWPESGEVDIMEYQSPRHHMGYNAIWLDKKSGSVDACSHWPENINGPGHPNCSGENDANYYDGWHNFPHKVWHTYGFEWEKDSMRFWIDGMLQGTYEIPDENRGEFNNPHFFIANLAVGGTLGGEVKLTDYSEAALYVDYLRYYGKDTTTIKTPNGIGDCKAVN